jgi:hypothetical protein
MNGWDKWVRARVVNRYHNGDHEVFFIDYGYRMDMRKVYDIPDEFKEDFHLVKKGSLCVTPQEYWSDPIKDLCKKLNDNKSLELRFVLTCKNDDLYVGDIFVFSTSGNYSLTDRLKECDKKITTECNFERIYETLTKASLPKPSFPYQKIEITKELDLAAISEILFHQSDFKAPTSLIINGKGLKAQWPNAEKTLFDSLIKREISKENLSDIQMSIWPQLHSSYRHAIIISNQPDYASLYLPALLNNVIRSPSNRNKPEFMGPIAIIFAHCSTKAEEIAKQCERIVKNFKVVRAFGNCDDKKVDIINGCDILVTTPPAFTRLTNNIALRIIDVNRLHYIAFDAFHMISPRYQGDINRIVKFCLADGEKIPQIILTAGIFTNDIRQKFFNQLPREKTVVCFDSFIEAAACAGMEIKLEICESFDEKVEKLLKDENLENSVIVANDKDAEILRGLLSSKNVKIITDSTLESSNIKNAKNLVHFSTAKNWKIFTNRFGLMYERINDRLDDDDGKLTSTVLFGEQDIAEFEALMTFMVDRKLFKGNLKTLEVKKF